eukprot:GHRQ01035452.1.p1 GENE.GHRQ01035452.1~~GHRQ01035452.1.p1  ORF type:complete len:151 (-),score=34.60 GHRQ01035452.1:304-756(-)
MAQEWQNRPEHKGLQQEPASVHSQALAPVAVVCTFLLRMYVSPPLQILYVTSNLLAVLRCRRAAAAANGSVGTSSATGQVDFSPAFVWLLRDFQLRLESNGHTISPAEYLEEALLPVKGGEADIANRNQVGAARTWYVQAHLAPGLRVVR